MTGPLFKEARFTPMVSTVLGDSAPRGLSSGPTQMFPRAGMRTVCAQAAIRAALRCPFKSRSPHLQTRF